jgi:hypothetical protein
MALDLLSMILESRFNVELEYATNGQEAVDKVL